MDIESIGVGGIFLVLVLKEVLNFLRKNNGNGHEVVGLRSKPADYSVEFGELMRIIRDLDEDRRLRAEERIETLRMVRDLHAELLEQKRKS